ncbi:putative multidrug resistance-associated protein lethal, partial [Danaus plexippus plexippus]
LSSFSPSEWLPFTKTILTSCAWRIVSLRLRSNSAMFATTVLRANDFLSLT